MTDKETPLKDFIVEYVGQKLSSGEEVTVEMIVEVMAEEFPEFLMLVAEENWIRGYEQALDDVSEGERLMKESNESNEE
jgi:hypothetical protein|tara:strand:- start:898 stop:1134 length:237 start_codon:yes stop_codon:yes gene_type:complete